MLSSNAAWYKTRCPSPREITNEMEIIGISHTFGKDIFVYDRTVSGIEPVYTHCTANFTGSAEIVPIRLLKEEDGRYSLIVGTEEEVLAQQFYTVN